MVKDELVELIKSVDVAWNEGVSSEQNNDLLPRLVFWEYYWENIMASGDSLHTNVTYQVSFFSSVPRDPKLLKMLKLFNEKGINPNVNIEFIEDKKEYHSFMSIEVVEDVVFKIIE